MSERLQALAAAGVSIWLDDLDRDRITSGDLSELIAEDSVVGVTTNPAIFNKAISGDSDAYDAQLRDLASRGVSRGEAVRALTTKDVRAACDVLHAAWEDSNGVDGRVSIEVDPRYARHTEPTIAEARALAWMVDRPNTLIKIPGTTEGLPAITQALSEGISVNVTLIFSPQRYVDVMAAWLAGLEGAAANGHDLTRIQSVASFFVSRVDSAVDKRIDSIGTPEAEELRGKAAIANARLAYREFQNVMGSERWQALQARGAMPQRPLWASTGVKDPKYDDTRYVVQLVTAGCVNTMPQATLEAVADHGQTTGDTITPNLADAEHVFADLAAVGIDMADVYVELEDDGVDKFVVAWEELLKTIEESLDAHRGASA